MIERVQCRFSQGMVNETAANETTRTISAILSDESVALDMHIIKTSGIDTTDYMRNPVVPWAHATDEPPVARMTNIQKRGQLLVGDMQFATVEDYPFADTVYRLIRGRFLNATSISWFPIKYERAKERDRPDGLNFIECKLLECSIVPVPANPGALITARNSGIDTSPLRQWAERILDTGATISTPRAAAQTIYTTTAPPVRATKGANWKCGASRNLPLDEESKWDGAAAQKSVFAACKFDSDKPDLGKARKAFLAFDASAPKKRGSYKLPFASIIDGRLTASSAGIHAAASRLSQTDIPVGVQTSARAVIDEYEGKMTKKDDKRSLVTKRGLYSVANLAYLLAQIGSIKSDIDAEEDDEGDVDSPNPENMLAVIHALGKALTDMATEEVAELVANFDTVDADGAERALKAFEFTRAGKKLSKGDKDQLEGIHDHARRGARLMRDHIDHYSGEDLSDEDTRAAMFDSAEAIHDHHRATVRCMRDYIDGQAPATADNDEPIVGGRAAPAVPVKPALVEERTAEERRKRAAALQAQSLIDRAKHK